jgi:aminodeoxyfutalosine deaminase
MSPTSFIAALPKVDLHSHLVGSASVATVLSLARRHPGSGVPTELDAIREMFAFRDFAHFVRSPDDITDLVVGAARDAAGSKVRWLELTVTAATHLMAGFSGDDLARAAERGRALARERHRVEVGFIIDIPAEKGLRAADLTVDFLGSHRPVGTVAVGVAGLEAGFPRSMYAEHVAEAGRLGLPAVVHAGESTGPETVWSALRDLEAVRIGHGTSAHRDDALMRHLVEHAVPLEVCLTSNLRTSSVASLEEHPVRTYLERGIPVTLGTDDAGMFDTTLDREYRLLAETAGLGRADILRVVRDGVEFSLAPEPVKRALRGDIADVAAGAGLA